MISAATVLLLFASGATSTPAVLRQGFLGLSDDGSVQKAQSAMTAWRATDAAVELRGAVLDGPRRITDAQSELVLPLVLIQTVVIQTRGSERGNGDIRQDTHLVGLSRDGARVAIAQPFLPRRPFVQPKSTSAEKSEGIVNQAMVVDAIAALPLRWSSGDYVFWLLGGEQLSNPVQTNVQTSKDEPPSRALAILPVQTSTHASADLAAPGIAIACKGARGEFQVELAVRTESTAPSRITLVFVERGRPPRLWQVALPERAPHGTTRRKVLLPKPRRTGYITAFVEQLSSAPAPCR